MEAAGEEFLHFTQYVKSTGRTALLHAEQQTFTSSYHGYTAAFLSTHNACFGRVQSYDIRKELETHWFRIVNDVLAPNHMEGSKIVHNKQYIHIF